MALLCRDVWEALREAVEGGFKTGSAGARTNVVERQYGATPAGWAAHAGHDEVVQLLATT